LKLRETEALNETKRELDEAIFAEKFNQFTFFKQWRALKKYANETGVRIIGDVPIFVALDSADVWCNRSQFKLNAGRKAFGCLRRSARLFLKNRTALGQSDLRLGTDAG
jgi:4-alpha-glucanotransferase